MRKTLFFFAMLLIGQQSFSQSVQLFFEDYESHTETVVPGTSSNKWAVATCAGNGTSAPGTKAAYVTKSGSTPGCGEDGEFQFAMTTASSNQEMIQSSFNVQGKCTKNHVLTFDYRFNPDNQAVKAYIKFSLTNGLTWVTQDSVDYSATWKTKTIYMNELTNAKDFLIGVHFVYDNIDAGGLPLALDNIEMRGDAAGADTDGGIVNLCGQSTTVINANPYYDGQGTWNIINGTVTVNNTNSAQTGLNNLGDGVTTLVWTVDSPNCGISSDTIVITNSEAPSAANVQDTVFICANDTYQISTATPMSGTGLWTSTGSTVIANPSSPATSISNITGGWSQLIWTISSPGCPSNADTMHIFKSGTAQVITNDTIICFQENFNYLLEALPIDSVQTCKWMNVVGNGYIQSPFENVTEVINLSVGENRFFYEVTHPLCPKFVDTVVIYLNPCDEFKPEFPTVITPNYDGKNDEFSILHLQNLYPNCQMTIYNRYGSVVFESTGYQIPWDGTKDGERLPAGVYFFKLELNDPEATVYNGSISVIY